MKDEINMQLNMFKNAKIYETDAGLLEGEEGDSWYVILTCYQCNKQQTTKQ
jgi:hypothetical protein